MIDDTAPATIIAVATVSLVMLAATVAGLAWIARRVTR